MSNTSWLSGQHPPQLHLEHEYGYNGTGVEPVPTSGYPGWRGAAAEANQPSPQQFSYPHYGLTNDNPRQLGDPPFHPLEPKFGLSSQPHPSDGVNLPRYAQISPSPAYPSSSVQQSSQYANPFASSSRATSPSRYPQPDPRNFGPRPIPNLILQTEAHSTTLGIKRFRSEDESYVNYDMAGEESEIAKEDASKGKPGACARCKNLKVKCEFRSKSDTCRRCLNGGHECVIPGRKKRRVPPKREHLLGQIRDQAAEIQRLMEQLEAANRKISVASPLSDAASASDITQLESDVAGRVQNQAEVQDWVAKARESIAAFGGFIGIGSASSARNLIEDTDSDDSDSHEEYEPESDWAEENSIRYGEGPHPRVSVDDGGRKKDVSSEKMATVPSQVTVFGLMANLSLRRHRSARALSAEADDDEVGIARDDYFRAAPDPTQRIADPEFHEHPHILTRGIVTPEEADKLFEIYFQRMNLSFSLLDPVLYTAQNTFYRSPFLFTVICAIAARNYTPKPSLYQETMRYARLAAGTALIGGKKTIETVSAYILLSLCPSPVKRWEEERGWIFLGTAIRFAIDLNLNVRSTAKPKNEMHARELLNRTRVWLNCYNLDRSTGSQYGKGPVIPNDDYIACHSGDWWRSEYAVKDLDIQTCAYSAELRLMGEFRAKLYSDPDHPTGFNKEVDVEKLASEMDDNVVALKTHWLAMFAENTDLTDLRTQFRTGLVLLAYSYARLAALSFGLQYLSTKGNLEDNPFVTRCWRAATEVCTVVLEQHIPEKRIYFRHGPAAQSIYVAFAAAFLIKLLHPKYSNCFSSDQRQGMYDMVLRVVEALAHPDVAIDEQHWPNQYSRLLRGLLADAKLDSIKRLQRAKTKSESPKTHTSTPALKQSPVMNVSLSLTPSPASSVVHEPSYYTDRSKGTYPSGSPLVDRNQHPETFSLETTEFFTPPLPFDSDMLQSMHSLTNSWDGMVLPGMNWMGRVKEADTDMKELTSERLYYPGQAQQFMQ